MIRSEAYTTVSVSPQTAFAFVADPFNLVKLIPGLTDVSDVSESHDSTVQGQFQYQLAGVSLTGRFRDSQRDHPSLLVRSLTGAIDGTWRYRFEETPDGTAVSHSVEMQFPAAVRDRLAERVVQAYVDGEVSTATETMRAFLNARA